MGRIVVAINCGLFEGSIHAFDLTIGPWMIDASKAMLNAIGFTDPVKDVLKGISVLLEVGELNAVVGQHDVNTVRDYCNQVAQEAGRDRTRSVGMQFNIDKL